MEQKAVTWRSDTEKCAVHQLLMLRKNYQNHLRSTKVIDISLPPHFYRPPCKSMKHRCDTSFNWLQLAK